MGFWGLEVKPGKPQPYNPCNVRGQLHVTQATLGLGSGETKTVLQCSIGDKSPIYLCSLLPSTIECCPLSLVFDDNDELVEFSVIGEKSIHLSGYFEEYELDSDQEEDDSDGIDIAETDSDESSLYGSEGDYDTEEDFIDDDDDDIAMYQQSSVPNSGVVIEEIEDEEKPAKEVQPKRSKKKCQSSEDENLKKQIIVKGSARVPVLESEDEDGFPVSKEEADKTDEKKGIDDSDQTSKKKRKAIAAGQDGGEIESEKKNKKKKKQKERKGGENSNGANEAAVEQAPKENELKNEETHQVSSDKNESSKSPDTTSEKKKKKKRKKNKDQEAEDKTVSGNNQDKQKLGSVSEGNQENSKSSQTRTYPNGLIVEELVMGKPDGKRASPGKQVSVRYIGKLQKNGKIFDSNIGKAPFKFRLGVGQVIKGWDVGVNGMRVGDKRRLTIPPSMGYGHKGAGGQIPPNAWLVFDVELINVN
ncbi:PREDICTED: peptidyl-prolyl cis-trans isomerase FKBP53 [Tarenaya hassleriana]|uniref:peptidyl-prolyl cis-trans isomerase FKBP53 n=1 Tax=Tarenaya hassleriana TaxID=28532 RepID=UPI00053C7107|nr:PREDICTED: peptidyl-prolyl cis-trans isomerase FKBP53 [Tarenaya hassleriana]